MRKKKSQCKISYKDHQWLQYKNSLYRQVVLKSTAGGWYIQLVGSYSSFQEHFHKICNIFNHWTTSVYDSAKLKHENDACQLEV